MQTNKIRKLTDAEIAHIKRYILAVLPDFPDELAIVFSEYFTESFRQNKTGEILLHEHDEWNRFNFRYGADSVIGTFCEMIAAWHIILMGLKVELIDDKIEQKHGRDLRIVTPTRKWSVSVKKKLGEHDVVRLNSTMFTHNEETCIDVDVIAFIDFDTIDGEFYDYPHLSLFWKDNKRSTIKGEGEYDRYWYVSSNNFMLAKL